MRPLSFRNAALIAGALLVLPAAARADENGNKSNPSDGQGALASSLSMLRRVLHLDKHGSHLDKQDEVVSHAIAVSSREATLDLEMANGHTRSLSLRGGHVFVDGVSVGSYTPGGSLERGWRRALADGASLDTRSLLVALRAWRGPSLSGDEAAAKSRLDDALKGLAVRAQDTRVVSVAVGDSATGHGDTQPVSLRLSDLRALDSINDQLQSLSEAGTDVAGVLRETPVRLGNVVVAAGKRVDGNLVVFKGNADISGEVTGSVVALYGDVLYHRGAVIGRDAVSVGGQVRGDGGTVHGDIKMISQSELDAAGSHEDDSELKAAPARHPTSTLDLIFRDVRNVVAVFVAFAMLGFGTVFFGRRYIEVVADTASHSFGRSFVVGLLGQLLVLPTFAMLLVGLIFTIVGILLLPFAAVAFVIAAILAVVGGYLAVAHAIGETFTRRRMAHGAFVRAPNAYGYLFAGLVGLMGLWAAAALTGWMGPVVFVFRLAAVIVTWIAATTGFGAVLLSRAGLRESFAGRHIGEMSDEYLWATPPATPTASRMNMKS
jgi:hypothetical protein